MRAELQEVIDKNIDVLSSQLDVNSGILNRLVARQVITTDHLDQIKAEKTTRQKNETLFDILKRRDDRCFFLLREEVTKEQQQLAERCLALPDDTLPFPVPQSSS